MPDSPGSLIARPASAERLFDQIMHVLNVFVRKRKPELSEGGTVGCQEQPLICRDVVL